MLLQTKSLFSEDVCYFVFQEISKQHVFKGQSKGSALLSSIQSQDDSKHIFENGIKSCV